MDNDEKIYYVTISNSNNTKQKSWLEKHQYIINFIFALATLIFSITTSFISIKLANQSNELQIKENLPTFYYEQSIYESNKKYDYNAISLKNNGGIIKNGLCEVVDIVTLSSPKKNYKFILSANYNTFQNDSVLFFEYDNNTESFSFCQNDRSVPIKYIYDSFNAHFKDNNLPYSCYTDTYIKISYTDYQNNNQEEYFQLINTQLYSIDRNIYENKNLCTELYYFENILNTEEILSQYLSDFYSENFLN